MAKIILNVELVNKQALAGLDELKKRVKEVADSLINVKPDADLTKQIQALASYYKNLTAAAEKANKAEAEQAALQVKLAKLEADAEKAVANKAKATSQAAIAAEKAAQEIEKTRAATEKANAEEAKAEIQSQKLAQQTAKTATTINDLGKEQNTAKDITEEFVESFTRLTEKFASFVASSLLIRKPLDILKNALGDIGNILTKTEDAVIELNRVLDDPRPAQEVSGRLYDLAYQYGQTFENASTIAANFARTGRDFNESLKATEAALLAMNVAELNATQASEGLISILAQFHKAPEDLLTVVDQLNKAADKNPVTTGKLLTALQRTGSSADHANLSLERTVGVITALSEATNRSGQNLGTAVNSLIQYSTKAESLNLFASLSEDAAKAVEAYRIGAADILDVWQAVSVEIQKLQNESAEKQNELFAKFDSAEVEQLSSTLHDELGDIFDQLGDVYNVANTYRKNYFIALLANMDRVFHVEEQISNAQGYSQEENAKYMETYTAKVNQLQASWQKLANDEQGILGLKKALVEMGIGLVDFIDRTGGVLNNLERIAAIAAGLAITLNAQKIVEGWGTLASTLKGIPGLFKNIEASATSAQAAMGLVGVAIAIAGLAVTSLNAAYSEHQEKIKAAREEAIQKAEAHHDEAIQLRKLYDQYKELDPTVDEYRVVEDKIVSLLGDKKDILSAVTERTDEYRKAVEKLTESQLNNYRLEAEDAKRKAKEKLEAKADERRINASNLPKEGLKEIISNWDDYFAPDRKFYRLVEDNYGSLDAENIIAQYEKLQKKVLELADAYYAVGDAESSEAKQIYENWQLGQSMLDAVKGDIQDYQNTLTNADDIIKSVLGEEAEEAGKVADALEAVGDSAEKGAKKSAEAINEQISAYLADAKAIETVKAAQEELNSTGTISIDTASKLAALGEDWVDVLFDENGALDWNTAQVWKLITAKRQELEARGYSISAAEEEKEAVEQLTEVLADYSSQIDAVQSSLSVLTEVQREYDETGSLSIDTFQKLLELGGDYLDLIIDEEGQLRLNEEAVEALKHKKEDLIQKLIEENTTQYALSRIQEIAAQKEYDVGAQAETAALKVGTFVAQLYALKGQSAEAAGYLDQLRSAFSSITGEMGVSLTPEELDRVIADSYSYYDKLSNAFKFVDTSGGWSSSSGSSSSSSSSTKDEELERRKSIVSLRESELTLMEHQGASEEEQIAKIRQIQAGIHDVAEYLRSTNASQEDINKEMSEWWKWEEKINKFAEDRAKAAEKEASEREKAAEAAKKAAEEQIKAETSRLKQVLADDKARLTLMEKQGKSVSDRVEQMKQIQTHLHDEAEWLRKIGAEQAEIDALSAEWWDWQDKILKLYKETLDTQKQMELDAAQNVIDSILKEIDLEEQALEISEKRLAVDKARADLEDAIAKAKIDYVQSVLTDYLTALDDAETLESKQRAVAEAREKLIAAQREAQAKSIIDTFKAEKDAKSDVLSIEEKRLAVEKARQALAEAENERTTRVYNEASGQWEYQANAKNVQSAKDALQKAIDALNAYAEEQAWNEVAEAVEKGSVSEEEVLEILAKWAEQSYGNGTPEFVAKIQSAFRKAMGSTASPDSVTGQISAVDNAIKSLNDYLKQQAVKELKEYIAAGNTDANGMKRILDKWLALGEGGELYEWRDGLLDSVNGAIRSGYYDDSAVQSQVRAVESAVESLHDYLRGLFIREIEDIVKNGTADEIRGAIERWAGEFDMSDTDRDWANRLADAKGSYESTESFWDRVENGNATDDDKRAIVKMMKANSDEWWTASDARKKELADINYMLGTSMGWHRKADGAWYDEYDRRLYDKGGVLRGTGGIKGTSKPEIVLDPELTSKILTPNSETKFREFTKAMHMLFEHGDRGRAELPVLRPVASTDSHNTSYTVNGIPIPTGAAERYTIAELFRAMPTARS